MVGKVRTYLHFLRCRSQVNVNSTSHTNSTLYYTLALCDVVAAMGKKSFIPRLPAKLSIRFVEMFGGYKETYLTPTNCTQSQPFIG